MARLLWTLRFSATISMAVHLVGAQILLFFPALIFCSWTVVFKQKTRSKIILLNLYLVAGTLYKHLNHCVTASGKRLLRRWICHPLKDIDAINKRLDVVEGFIQNCGLGPTALGYLRKIPDLERLLGQVRFTVGLSSLLQLPFIGEKILKRWVSGSFLFQSLAY